MLVENLSARGHHVAGPFSPPFLCFVINFSSRCCMKCQSRIGRSSSYTYVNSPILEFKLQSSNDNSDSIGFIRENTEMFEMWVLLEDMRCSYQ